MGRAVTRITGHVNCLALSRPHRSDGGRHMQPRSEELRGASLRRAAFALLPVRAAAKLSAAVVLVPAAQLCAHTPIGGWDFAPPCVNRVCAPADMGGAKAGPVRAKSPHWSRP